VSGIPIIIDIAPPPPMGIPPIGAPPISALQSNPPLPPAPALPALPPPPPAALAPVAPSELLLLHADIAAAMSVAPMIRDAFTMVVLSSTVTTSRRP
jgi:hypothetical protein